MTGWTKDEDEALLKAVAVHGSKAWSAISCALPGRTGKACRERWFNHLNPALRPDEWTPAEDATLFGKTSCFCHRLIRTSADLSASR